VVAVDEIRLLENDLMKESAFLCHYNAHWFALRKIGKIWFKLDSLARQPYRISEFYLWYFKM